MSIDDMDSPGDKAQAQRKAAMLCAEIQALISIMRQNSKWALVPGYGYEDDLPEDPLLEDFKNLRRKIFSWRQWTTRDPSTYLAPFLEVISSIETSGPITGMALSTVHRILSQSFFDSRAQGAAEAMHAIVDAVTHCRFEATDPDADEVVLARILQALLACLRCPAGSLLSDDDVCSIVQACFRIGHQSGKEGELLQQMARQTMEQMVRLIFHRLADMPQVPLDMSLPATPRSSFISNGGTVAENQTTPVESASNSVKDGTGAEPAELEPAVLGPPYGLPCVLEVFQFLVSLVGVDDSRDAEDLCVFALALINSALEEGAQSFAAHPQLLLLVRDDLVRNLLQAGTSSNLSVLSYLCAVFFSLYLNLRRSLKHQIEAFVRGVLLRLGDGRIVQYEQQRIALECLVDLCRQPTFMVDMYTNYDCSLECSNVFEDICSLLSKNSFPVNCPLSAVHLLSLEGLLAIVSGIADRSENEHPPPVLEQLQDAMEYVDFWDDQLDFEGDMEYRTKWLRQRKFYKQRLQAGIEHYNRDYKKGLEYMQTINLLPTPLDAKAVALFYRKSPGLDKEIVGEYLGDAKDFKVEVLDEYTKSFDFRDMTIDGSLRMYLDGFRLPGEAQKISRILEYFSALYYQHNGQKGENPSNTEPANPDAVYVLSYSIIMLNTDLHNKQVKKKMTLDQFISNNRGTNDGKDWHRQVLVDIYDTIAKDEIKLKIGAGVSSSDWPDVMRKMANDGGLLLCSDGGPQYDQDLFALLWGPTIAAMSVVFDHTEDEVALKDVLDGFLGVAKTAAAHRHTEVMDNLISSLCKFTTLLNPAASKPAVAFGEDAKARMAAVTVFDIANKKGNFLRGGWRNILDCILRLHKLDLLPSKVTELDGLLDGETRVTTQQRVATPKRSTSTSSIFRGLSSQFSQLLSLDNNEDNAAPSEGETEAKARTVQCIESCKIDEIFTDSKFLEAESLLQLVQALIWAAGTPASPTGRKGRTSETLTADEDTAIFCLEQLAAITLRNRDRMLTVWPIVFEHLGSIVQAATAPGPLVERAVFLLLRVCQRLLPYKEDIAEELLTSMQLLFKLDPHVAGELLERITSEVLALLKGSVTYIRSPTGWRTVTRLLTAAACHQEASTLGFEALTLVMHDAVNVSSANFLPCIDASLAFVASRVGGTERCCGAVDLLAGTNVALVKWSNEIKRQLQAVPGGAAPSTTQVNEELLSLWNTLLKAVVSLCTEGREQVRNHAVISVQRILVASEPLDLPAVHWRLTFEQSLLPLLADLATATYKRSSDLPDAERTLRMAVGMLSKAFLQYLPKLHQLPDFQALWTQVLEQFQKCMKCGRGDELTEAVPEALKNILLVMATQGVLRPPGNGTSAEAAALWEKTWKAAAAISPSLKPELLAGPPPATETAAEPSQ